MSLDDKIIEAVLGKPLQEGMPTPNFVEKIKQAFADEGYLTPEQKEQTQKLVNMLADQAQLMAKLPVTVSVPGEMTGRDWYDRFEKEANHDAWITGRDYNRAFRAAKRAAGIDHE